MAGAVNDPYPKPPFHEGEGAPRVAQVQSSIGKPEPISLPLVGMGEGWGCELSASHGNAPARRYAAGFALRREERTDSTQPATAPAVLPP